MAGETLDAEVSVTRGEFRLDAAVRIPPGVTVLFGPSGAGKSTLLAAMAGLLRPAAGTVRLGTEIWSDAQSGRWVPAHRRGLAFVFQTPALFPHLSVLSNAMFGVDRALARPQRRDRALAMLERAGVAHLAHRAAGGLSGGEAQRVALARAFAREPRLVLLDEPFASLHREVRTALADDARAWALAARVPMVHVTHDRAEAQALGERVIRLEAGRVVGTGGRELLDGVPAQQ